MNPMDLSWSRELLIPAAVVAGAASKQVRPGDYVKLGSGEKGFVADVTWHYTIIRALPNDLIVIPNAKLASAVVTNFNLPETEMAVVVQVGVSCGSDLEQVERITCDVARETMKAVPGGIPRSSPSSGTTPSATSASTSR
jgi:small-conductance mechanosensitive channel